MRSTTFKPVPGRYGSLDVLRNKKQPRRALGPYGSTRSRWEVRRSEAQNCRSRKARLDDNNSHQLRGCTTPCGHRSYIATWCRQPGGGLHFLRRKARHHCRVQKKMTMTSGCLPARTTTARTMILAASLPQARRLHRWTRLRLIRSAGSSFLPVGSKESAD